MTSRSCYIWTSAAWFTKKTVYTLIAQFFNLYHLFGLYCIQTNLCHCIPMSFNTEARFKGFRSSCKNRELNVVSIAVETDALWSIWMKIWGPLGPTTRNIQYYTVRHDKVRYGTIRHSTNNPIWQEIKQSIRYNTKWHDMTRYIPKLGNNCVINVVTFPV